MNNKQLLRYSRHILLKEINIKGQKKLLSSHVIIIGIGGIGSTAAIYLASSGIGKITLIDNDIVNLTNLQRQIIHNTNNLKKKKVLSGKKTLKKINPNIKIKTIEEKINNNNIYNFINKKKILLDCSDNFKTRFIINKACVKNKIPLISGSAIKFNGQICVFDKRFSKNPCYECVFPKKKIKEEKCSNLGIFSPLAGIIGAIQASETIKLIINIKNKKNFFYTLNLKKMKLLKFKIKKNLFCKICKTKKNIFINHKYN
ncbi:HesA/MoeB/ThiF family protein [Candidatus Zinderia endosymbiont of Aphrophora alni]|uniref:HesA/MoeB/ThiF family protein n=1 Tax=Candidatus Zinderia endosymbiont of Aphrophora alni TaxID=3077951 RepID=UPI0030D4FCB1